MQRHVLCSVNYLGISVILVICLCVGEVLIRKVACECAVKGLCRSGLDPFGL